MLKALDGPSKSSKLTSVGTATPVEVKVGASAFEDRKVITMQSTKKDSPNYGDFYVYFADEGETPNAATISANGQVQSKNAKESYEAGPSQVVYVLADSGTISIRITERG